VSQLHELERHAALTNRRIVRVFEDKGWSGTNFLKRPAFVEMLKLVESGKADFVEILVYDESRFSRAVDPRESTYWKLHFKRYGVTVVIVHSKSTGGNDIGSFVLEVVESAEASEYSQKLSRATLRGQKDNARRGFSNGGPPPYGLKRIAVDKVSGQKTRDLQTGEHVNQETEKSRWDIGNPMEVEVVKRIFAERSKGLGFVSIADHLNKGNVAPPRTGRRRNQNGKWSGGSVKAIIENRSYVGDRVFNVHPQSHLAGPEKPLWINKKEDWIVVEDAHQAIVSREVFELANRNRQPYQRKNRYTNDSPYLLTGLIRCSHCGCRFYGQNQKQKNVRYYEDSGYVSRGRSTCSSFKINKEKIERFVVQSIRAKILNSDLPVRLEKMLDENIKNRSVERLQQVEQYEKALSDAKIKIERLLTLVENGAAIEELIDRIKEAEKEKKKIEQKLDEMKLSNLPRKEIVEAKKEVQHLMEHFETILAAGSIPIQKELIRKFVHSIIVDRETDSVVVYLKAIPMLKSELNTPSTCIKVEKKMNRKARSADKVKQTEESNNELTQTGVLTEN